MAAITTDRRYRVPEWIHLEELAIRILEVHTGVKIRIPKLWLVYNYGKPIGYGDRILHASPTQYMRYNQGGKWYYEEDYYDFCQYGKDALLERPAPVVKHQCFIYPGKPYADIIDCSWLHTRQFYRWNPELQIISPDPDQIFKSKPMLVLDGLYDQHGWPYVYITRENMWDFKSYWFYPAVWVFEPYPPRKYDIFNPDKIPQRHATSKIHVRFLDVDGFTNNMKIFERISCNGLRFRYTNDRGTTTYNITFNPVGALRNYADLYNEIATSIKKLGNNDLWVQVGDEFIEEYHLDKREVTGCEMNICATDGLLELISENLTDCFTGINSIPEHCIVSMYSEYIGPTQGLKPVEAGDGGQTPDIDTNPIEYEWMCKGALSPKPIIYVTVGNPESVLEEKSPFTDIRCDRVSFFWYRKAKEPSILVTLNITNMATMETPDALVSSVNNALAARGMRGSFEFRYIEDEPIEEYEGVSLPKFGLFCKSGKIGPYSSFGDRTDFFYSSQNFEQEMMYLRAEPTDSPELPTPVRVTLTLQDLLFDKEADTAILKGLVEGTVTAKGKVVLMFPDGAKQEVDLTDYNNYWLFELPFPMFHLTGGNVFNVVATIENSVGETATVTHDVHYELPPSRDIRITMEPIDVLGDNKLTWIEAVHGISIWVRGIVTGRDAKKDMEVTIELPDGYKDRAYLGYNQYDQLFFSVDIPAEHFTIGTFVKAYIVEEVEGEKLVFSATATYILDMNPPYSYLIPCLPMFLLYPHDSYSQFDDASLESLPFRFDIPEKEWKEYYEEIK